jgi:hypothetical protein
MHTEGSEERRAIDRLIRQIDTLDGWRDRVGWRVVYVFAGTFFAALALLVWTVTYAHPEVRGPKIPDGPRAPKVLQSFR